MSQFDAYHFQFVTRKSSSGPSAGFRNSPISNRALHHRNPWRGRLNPHKFTMIPNTVIVDRRLGNAEKVLLGVFHGMQPQDKGWFEVSIQYLAFKLGWNQSWVRKVKGRLVTKGYLEEKEQFNERGDQIANLYRLCQPNQADRPTPPHSNRGRQVLRRDATAKTNLQPIPPTPQTEPTAVALAEELAGKLDTAGGCAEIIPACQEELTEKPKSEALERLTSDWKRWQKIAALFPGITTAAFWRIDRHFLPNLERDAQVKQERRRQASAKPAPRQHHQSRVIRPHCSQVQPDVELTPDARKMLDAYRHTPGTTGRVNQLDREVAMKLCERGISFKTVDYALAVGTIRRLAIPSRPLSRVKSLAYFRSVIDEVETDKTLPESGFNPIYGVSSKDAYYTHAKDFLERLQQTRPELFDWKDATA